MTLKDDWVWYVAGIGVGLYIYSKIGIGYSGLDVDEFIVDQKDCTMSPCTLTGKVTWVNRSNKQITFVPAISAGNKVYELRTQTTLNKDEVLSINFKLEDVHIATGTTISVCPIV